MTIKEEFLASVKSGDLSKVTALLKTAPSLVRAQNEEGVSAILLAAYHDRPEIVEVLLSRNPELDIFEAAAAGQAERVGALTEKDRTLVNAISSDGFSPLHLAAFFGHPEVVSLLIDRGADVNRVSGNPMRVVPLHSALAHRHADAVFRTAELLLSRGAEVNIEQVGGWTPLHQAVTHRLTDLVKLLLTYGADPEVKAQNGKTPIEMALQSGDRELLNLLREGGSS